MPGSRSLGERRGHGGWWGVGGGLVENPRLLAGALPSGAFCAVPGQLGPVSGVFRPWGGQTETGGGEKTALRGSWAAPGACFRAGGDGGGRERVENGHRAVVRAFWAPGWSLGRVEGVKGGCGAL